MQVAPDQLKEMFRLMVLIRAFECKARELYEQNRMEGRFLGALHSCEGEEAVAVGACTTLRTDDFLLSTHRGHGHAIAKGADPAAMMAELMGKETGISRGRGGSMHMFQPEIGLLGGNGIVGGGVPLALGPAFSAQYRGTDQVTACFFGDGGACQGGFHESLNLASLWKLPVVYICENNQYAVTTPIGEAASCEIAWRARGYGLPGVCVDGMNVVEVHEAVAEAVGRARTGDGPSLVECKTYRFQPHCAVIPDRRDADEKEHWESLDPIRQFGERLAAECVLSADEQDGVAAQARETMEAAVEFAESSPYPDPATAADCVWA